MKHRVNSVFLVWGISLMFLAFLFNTVLPAWINYVDDAFCAVVVVLFVISLFLKKKVFKFYFWIFLLILIGLMGNYMYDVQKNFTFALTDAFMFIKPYILLMYIIISVNSIQAQKIYRILTEISKIAIIILAVAAILSLLKLESFIGIIEGMVNSVGEFEFYTGFTGSAADIIIVCLTIIVSNPRNNRLVYYVLSLIVILRTGSGLGILAIVGYAAVYFFMERKKKFHWYYLLIIVPLCFWVGRNEITSYLLNAEAPRYLLFYYSIITAWEYLPIGAGFATYGSSVAANQYSNLYYLYGFSNRWGMGKNDTGFLVDSYYPQIIAQTGFLGSALYGIFMYKLFFKIIMRMQNNSAKTATIYLFAIWAVSGLGFGSSSLWGCLVYAVIPILYLVDKYDLYECRNVVLRW